MGYKKEYSNLVENLDNSFFELLKLNDNEAIEYLEEEEIDVMEFDNDSIEFIKKLQARTRIALGKNARLLKNILEKAKDLLKQSSLEEVLNKILPPEEQEQLSFQFRNIEEFDDEAKLNLLSDAQLLKVMDWLNKKEKNT